MDQIERAMTLVCIAMKRWQRGIWTDAEAFAEIKRIVEGL